MLNFSDILGQDAVKRHFTAAVVSDRVSHAYMLTGEAGMGKSALAGAFAAMLLCERDPLHPCGVCHACRQVSADTHPDLIRVTHEKPNSISVEEVRRQICAEAVIRPFSGKKRIFIVPEAEKMTPQAQNALLKTIEEPPEYVVILLLTESEEALLETIRSRCVKLKMRPVPEQILRKALQSREDISEETIPLAVSFARGVPGKALEMAQSEEFRQRCALYRRTMEQLPGGSVSSMLEAAVSIREADPGMEEFFSYVRMYCRDLLVLKKDRREKNLIFSEQAETLTRAAGEMTLRGAGRILDELEQTEDRLRANVSGELALEMLLEEIRESRKR
ncbi:MAG: DNA polymerase III subunit delta' [Stomatobaculum sp.]|nr:DNA polymerase III subunit delta' [Stomatobaculum sp.]